MLFDSHARTWQLGETKTLQQSMNRKYRNIWSNKGKPPLMQMQREGRRRELGVKSVRLKIEKIILQKIGHVMRLVDIRLDGLYGRITRA